METTSLPMRIYSREELSDVELSEEQEDDLRALYDTFQEEGAVVVQPTEPFTSSSASIMESLHRERVFPYISSYMSGDLSEGERLASAKVTDPKTEARLRADAWRDELIITPGSESVPFESFRDYLVFLQISLHTEFEPAE